MGELDRPASPVMRRHTDTRRLRLSSGWVQVAIGIASLIIVATAAYAAFKSEHTAAVTRIERIERDVEKLDALREKVAEVQTEQRAQRHVLDRIDRTLQALAKPK